MLILQVENSAGDKFHLDLYENEQVSLNFRFQDLESVNGTAGSYSQTFRIPATEANVDFFGAYHDVDVVGGFNAKRKTDARLIDDGFTLIEGHIQLVGVVLQKGHYADFELNFMGETADLASELKGVELKDLDLSALDNILTLANMNSGLSSTGLNSGAVRFGIIDRGFGWYNGNQINQYPMSASQLTPFVRLEKVVDAIFAKTGYSYTSTWLSGMTNCYVPCYNGGLQIKTPSNLPQFRVAMTSDLTINTETTTYFSLTDVAGSGNLANLFDVGSVFNDSADTFTPTATGYYHFRWDSAITPNEASRYKWVIAKTDNTVVYESNQVQITQYTVGTYNTDTVYTGSAPAFLESGTAYKFGIETIATWEGPDITISGSTGFELKITNIGLNTIEGQGTVELEKQMPTFGALDFLRGLQRQFNLVFVQNNDQFTIEPAQDFLYSGTPLDWTDKLDTSVDMTIRPTTDLQGRYYEFNHAETGDIINESFVRTAGRTFGRYRIEDTENDFTTETVDVAADFAPFMISRVGSTNMLVYKGYDSQGEALTDHLPMLAFYVGQRSFDFNITHAGTSYSKTEYPLFSQFSTEPATFDTDSLLFGAETAHEVDAMPTNTLFTSYWEDYFNELYSSDARIVECAAYLTRADIATLDWSDSIYINGSQFRLLEVNNFVVNDEQTCRLTLLKKLSPIVACAFIPSAVTNGGVVTFTDVDGNTGQTGTETCCVKYGYEWTGTSCVIGGHDGTRPTTDGDHGRPGDFEEIQDLRNFIALDTDGVAKFTVSSGTTPLNADQVDDGSTTNKFATADQLSKVDFLTVTGSVDLDNIESGSGSLFGDLFPVFIKKF